MISMKAWVFRFLIQVKMPNVVNNAARRELKNVLDMVSELFCFTQIDDDAIKQVDQFDSRLNHFLSLVRLNRFCTVKLRRFL